MANKKTEPVKNRDVTIEEWQGAHKGPMAIHYGACTRKNWKPGKVVVEEEYRQAISEFLEGGISHVEGRKA